MVGGDDIGRHFATSRGLTPEIQFSNKHGNVAQCSKKWRNGGWHVVDARVHIIHN